jgi:multiple sugar transport system permease protein
MSDPKTATAAAESARGRKRLADNPGRLGWLLLAPTLLYVFGLVALPLGLSLLYSVTNVTVSRLDYSFRGLDHFRAIFQNPAFWVALKNTFIYAIGAQVIVIIMGNVLALALMKNFRGKWFVRLLILFPFVAPVSLGALGWMWIFDPTYSVLNYMARAVHILGPMERFYWLGPELGRFSITLVNVWRTLPLATIILVAGLGSIPQDIHDAALMDGANFWRRHFQVTLPMITPILMVATLFGLVFSFTDMVVIFILTKGGPFNTTHNLASLAYFTGVEAGDLGEGAAISLFLLPLLVVIAILMLRVARRSEVI